MSAINALLAGSNGGTAVYSNSLDAPATSATLTLSVNDLGNTGLGGALSASDTATINITRVNDAPTAAISPSTFSATEQVTLNLAGSMSIGDVDGDVPVTVVVSVGEGQLTVTPGSSGATVSGSGTSSVTISGTISQVSTVLNGASGATVLYLNPSDTPSASTSLTINVNDLGNIGTGGPLSANSNATINITAVNDAPVANDLAFQVGEGQTFFFDLAPFVSDAESADSLLTYQYVSGPTPNVGTLSSPTTSTWTLLHLRHRPCSRESRLFTECLIHRVR